MRNNMRSLKETRESCGISVEKVARILGISAKRYRALERFPDWIDVHMAVWISSIISVPLDNIFFARSSTKSRYYFRNRRNKNGNR